MMRVQVVRVATDDLLHLSQPGNPTPPTLCGVDAESVGYMLPEHVSDWPSEGATCIVCIEVFPAIAQAV
jgi:hypothetical protein